MWLRYCALILLGIHVASAEPVFIRRIVDGDTVALADGRHVRLLGIDTPEKWHSAKLERDSARTGQSISDIVALGKLATAHTAQLLANPRATLTYDRESTDKYRRTLGYLTNAQGVLVNLQLVRDGYACALTKYPVKINQQVAAAQKQAQQKGVGLWSHGLRCD